MTMRERIANGMLFTDMCEGLPEERMRGKKFQKAFNDSNPEDVASRIAMWKEMFAKGEGIWIEPPMYFCYGSHISIGKGTYINVNCNFIDDGPITIGENCLFGPAVTIATVGHPLRPDLRCYMYCDGVTIGNNVWIGGGVTICPGVTIGDNAVIGAGSVVVHDVPANTIAVGNPARVLREFNEHDMNYYYKNRPVDEKDLETLEFIAKGENA